jgi:hypothetical protein
VGVIVVFERNGNKKTFWVWPTFAHPDFGSLFCLSFSSRDKRR